MKLRKIKWNQHPVLGDLSLDFINHQTNEPYSTILLAGENGTGKSTILEAISSFLNLGPYENFDYIEYAVGDSIYKTSETTDGTQHKPFLTLWIKMARFKKSDMTGTIILA